MKSGRGRQEPNNIQLFIELFWTSFLSTNYRCLKWKAKEFVSSCSFLSPVLNLLVAPSFHRNVGSFTLNLFDLLPAFFLLQTLIPNYYEKAKEIQSKWLHDQRSTHRSILLDLPAVGLASLQSSIPCLNPYHPVSITTDGYSAKYHESYICITAHFLNDKWVLEDCLLDIMLCSDNHSGENIAAWLDANLEKNKICV